MIRKGVLCMFYYNIDLSEFKSDQMTNAYIDYLFSKVDLISILKKLNISKSSYFYAKKNGYINSPKFMSTILESGFYKETSDEQFLMIENALRGSITESYFADNVKLQAIRKDFLSHLDSYQGTVLEIVTNIFYINSLDLPITDETEIKKIYDIINMILHFKKHMSHNTLYLVLLSISEFYQVTRDALGMKMVMQEMIQLEPNVDEHLLLLGYYDMVAMETMMGELKKSYYYINKCEDLCYKYGNFKRLGYLRANKRFIAYKIGNFEQASSLASSDIVSLIRGDDEVMLCSTIIILVNSLISLKRYNEALEYTKILYNQSISDYYINAILFEAYINYKINKNIKLEKYLKQMESYRDKPLYNDGLNLLKAIIFIQSGTKKNMKQASLLVKPIDEQKYSRLNSMASHLRNEFEEYIRLNNKMLSIYDMI